MPGIRTSILSLLLAGAVLGQSPDYFPLLVSGQWIYRGSGPQAAPVLLMEVARSAQIDGREYFLLRSRPGGETWVRRDEAGAIRALDPESKREFLRYDFQAASERNAEYKGAVGEYDYALAVEQNGRRELFLPWIGMISRSEESGASYDLVYSRVGATVVAQPELSFALALDRYFYEANPPRITARLTLRNTTATPLDLTFPSGQSYDFAIRNENGDVVYRWSDGMAFALAIRNEQFTGERNYAEVLEPRTPLPAGKYTLAGWLTTSGTRAFTASAPFEVR
jgi:hypothetical protein